MLTKGSVFPLFQLVLLTSVIGLGVIGYGQQNPEAEPKPPAIDLLKLDGSKPNLAANGEGIISYKIRDLYKRGVTRVKPFDLDFKIELPAGYTLFNNLAYVIESEAVFSGPNEVVFSIPSVGAKESFDRLRILYAERDDAEPTKPRWVDSTVLPDSGVRRYLSEADYEKRLPDFTNHTLHVVMEDRPAVMVVALKDTALARDNFNADLMVTVSAPESVMEGREIKQVFVVTNKGPDTATAVSFSAQVGPEFVALSQSQGVCRWEAHNIYCNLGALPAGSSATITNDGKCRWDFFYDDKPVQSGGQNAYPSVGSAELDPHPDNNYVFLDTEVTKDPNKGPLVAFVSPTEDQFFVGPEASIKVVVQASDPDGTISKVELFDGGERLGAGKLKSKDQYEFTYENVSFGHHWLTAVATDNAGRPNFRVPVNVHVNGQARVKIVNPTAKQVIKGPVEDLPITFRATHPSKAIKKVVIHLGLHLGGIPQTATPGPGADEYSTTFKNNSGGGTYAVYAVVTDDADVTTLSEPVNFRVTEPPVVDLNYFDGEYSREVIDGAILSAASPIELLTNVNRSYDVGPTSVAKVEFYADEELICLDINHERNESTFYNYRAFKCAWRARPGKHTLSAIATDSDGVVGKSKPVTILVQ